MSKPIKIAWAVLAAIFVGIGVAVFAIDDATSPTPADTAEVSDLVVRPDSQRLSSHEQSRAQFV